MAKPQKKVNLGELGDAIYSKNEEISAANARVKELELEKRELENRLLAAMQDAGTDIVRGDRATISISTSEKPTLDDYEKFTSFVVRKKAYHLFEKRLAVNAVREMIEQLGGKPIPGVGSITLTRLNVRKIA